MPTCTSRAEPFLAPAQRSGPPVSALAYASGAPLTILVSSNNYPPLPHAVNPELAALIRRLKTIYAITGGELPAGENAKKNDFNTKKSILIAQLHNFEQVCSGFWVEERGGERVAAAG